jgi:regulator of sigma E protease
VDSCLTLLAGIDLFSSWLLAATADKPSVLFTYLTVAKNLAIVGLGLGFVIFVHELGHFLVAKACGVKCEKFYVGFDWFPLTHIGPIKIPHTLFKMQWGETEYGIGVLPLGGYVKMLGQDDNPANQAAENERIRQTGDEAAAADQTPKLDPRSFQAKSVPKRMAIICAGVAMNMLTAPFMAGAAYYFGMPYTTTDLGGTTPGGPAWKAGLEPGDKILQIADKGPPSEELRFDFDLKVAAALAAPGQDIPMVVRGRDGKSERTILVRPVTLVAKPPSKFLGLEFGGYSQKMVGVSPATTTEFGGLGDGWNFTAKTVPETQKGDVITHIEGNAISKGWEVQDYFASHVDQPVTITVRRPEKKSKDGKTVEAPEQVLDIKVDPLKLKTAGFAVAPLGVDAIQTGSPAETAGFKPGDIIESIDGEAVTDPFLISLKFLALVGKKADVVVRRGEEKVTLTVEPTAPKQYSHRPSLGADNNVAVEPIGLAYKVDHKVGWIDPTFSLDLQPGDELIRGELVTTDEKLKEELEEYFPGKKKKFDLVASTENWQALLMELAPRLPEGVNIRLTYRRGEEEKSTDLTLRESATWFSDDRNLPLRFSEGTKKAASMWEGFTLGVREAKEKLLLTIKTVGMLLSGQASLKDTSGPAGIANIAYDQAGGGIPKFLMFLTLISVNLAVMNMLPIPVLDGGHMVFLTYEWLRGKPVDEAWQIRLSVLGLLALLSLMAFATMNDLTRFFM